MKFRTWFAVLTPFLLPACVTGGTIDFEGFSDGTILTTQFAGLTFSNAIILTAGI